MIPYEYKTYHDWLTRHHGAMLRESTFEWNHAFAFHKRYYRLYGKYIGSNRMQNHFAKRISRSLLHLQDVQGILECLDTSCRRFFTRQANRPPKFREASGFFGRIQAGRLFPECQRPHNIQDINKIKKRFKFSLSRPYERKGQGTRRQVQPPWRIFHRHGARQATCHPRKDTRWCIRRH